MYGVLFQAEKHGRLSFIYCKEQGFYTQRWRGARQVNFYKYANINKIAICAYHSNQSDALA